MLNRVGAQMEGTDRTVTLIAFIHRSYPLPSTASSHCRSSLDLSTGDIETLYHLRTTESGAIRLFGILLREENVLAYLRLRFLRPSDWIAVVEALHEGYLSPRDEYQRHHPPAPSSAGANWPAVWEAGDGHGDHLRNSPGKRDLHHPTMRMNNAKSHEPYMSRVAEGLRYWGVGDAPPARSGKQLLRGVEGVR